MGNRNYSQDKQKISKEEKNVSLQWNIGDEILGMYNVLPVDGKDQVYHAGGMGKVYKIHHTSWDINLAVKAPHSNLFKTLSQKDNFIAECQTWIDLGIHPNIATCYYIRELGGAPRIFAEYVDGSSLSEWINTKKLYQGNKHQVLKRIIDISIQFAWGLHYAHQHGIVHRDVKPQNVMLTSDFQVKVVDFGIARARIKSGIYSNENSSTMMVTGSGGYTPLYCSPEQMSGQMLTRRTDIWSWAVSVLEMFRGEVCWAVGIAAKEAMEMMIECPDEESDIPSMPKSIVELLERCFEKLPSTRPESMLDIANELINIYENETGQIYPLQWNEGALDTADVLNNKALSYIDMGDKQKATVFFDKALANDSQNINVLYNSLLFRWRNGIITDYYCINAIEAYIKEQPDLWEVEYLLALIHIERLDKKSAVDVINKAIEKYGDRPEFEAALKQTENMPVMRLKTRLYRTQLKTYDFTFLYSNRCFIIGDRAILIDSDNLISYSLHRECAVTSSSVKFAEKVVSARIFDNSTKIIGVSRYGEVRVWRTDNLRCIAANISEIGGAYSIAVSPDLKHFAVLGTSNIFVGNLDTLNRKRKISINTGFSDIAITHDSKQIITCTEDCVVCVYDISSGELIYQMDDIPRHEKYPDRINCIVISQDSRFAVVAGELFHIYVFDLIKRKLYRRISTNDYINCVQRVNHSSKNLVIAAHGGKTSTIGIRTLILLDIESGECLRTFLDTDMPVGDMHVDEEGKRAISIDEESKVMLWDTEYRKINMPWQLTKPSNSEHMIHDQQAFNSLMGKARTFIKHKEFFQGFKELKAAREIPSFKNDDELFKLWGSTYKHLKRTQFLEVVEKKTDLIARSIIMPKKGEYMIVKHEKDRYYVHEIDTLKQLYPMEIDEDKEVSFICMSDDGSHVCYGYKNMIIYYDILNRKHVFSITFDSKQYVAHAVVTQNNEYLICGHTRGQISIINISSRKLVYESESILNSDKDMEYTNHSNTAMEALAITNNGRYAVLACKKDDDNLHIWDIVDRKYIAHIKANYTYMGYHHTKKRAMFLIQNDGPKCFSSTDEIIKINNEKNRDYFYDIKKYYLSIKFLCISNNDKYLLSGNNEQILVWNLSMLRVVTNICITYDNMHSYAIKEMMFCNEGNNIIIQTDKGEFRMYDSFTGKIVYSWRKGNMHFLPAFVMDPSERYVIMPLYEDKSVEKWHLLWDCTHSVTDIISGDTEELL